VGAVKDRLAITEGGVKGGVSKGQKKKIVTTTEVVAGTIQTERGGGHALLNKRKPYTGGKGGSSRDKEARQPGKRNKRRTRSWLGINVVVLYLRQPPGEGWEKTVGGEKGAKRIEAKSGGTRNKAQTEGENDSQEVVGAQKIAAKVVNREGQFTTSKQFHHSLYKEWPVGPRKLPCYSRKRNPKDPHQGREGWVQVTNMGRE